MDYGNQCPKFHYPPPNYSVPKLMVPIDCPAFIQVDWVDQRMQAELAFFPLVDDRNPVTMPVFDVSGNGVPPERDRYYTLSPDREAIGQLSYFRIFGYNDAKVDPHQFNWWKFWWRISVRNSHDKEVWFENFSVRC